MSQREQILTQVRAAIANAADVDSIPQRPTTYIRPKLAQSHDLVAQFCTQLELGGGSYTRLSDAQQIPTAIKQHLAAHNLPARLVAAPALAEQPWVSALDIRFDRTRGDDLVSLTPCFCAVAETGSAVLLSDPDSPTSLNFLPDDHLVIVYEQQIVAHLEDVWQRLRVLPAIPRSVNFITGPSKTADVEQTLQIGAHGPRRLHVLLVK